METQDFKCPIGLDKIHCPSCQFQKEGLCDYPYSIQNLTPMLGDRMIINGLPYLYVKAGKDIICKEVK